MMGDGRSRLSQIHKYKILPLVTHGYKRIMLTQCKTELEMIVITKMI